MKKETVKTLPPQLIIWGGLGLFLVVILFPFYWMVISSTKTFGELFATPPVLFPREFSLNAYYEVLFTHKFLRYFINSFSVSFMTVALNVPLAVLGAYALSRLSFRGKRLLSQSVLLIYILPPVLLVIPLFAILSRSGLRDSLSGLILTYLAQTLPVSLYMLGNYFRALPPDIEEAGLMDGCTRIQVIRKITLPLSMPVITSVALYTFMIAWNEFLFAYIFLDSPEKFTLSKGLFHLFGSYHTSWDMVMAASVIMTLPVIAIFLIFERYLVSGLITGGVKG
ncbi:MAG: carbohydrate ABC transporter permease [Thermodesulfobacteriota bacterium]|nr:carbohydrate ABC transporter permease [Thermodesulfobacteriota bacterium]